MKIKTKKQLNLPQLIEWALKNGIKNKHYVSENHYIITFDKIGFLENSTLPLDEIFNVEVEEEITEDTVLPKLVTKNINGDYNEWTDRSVDSFIIEYMEAIYILNDDHILNLVWTKEKGLVE